MLTINKLQADHTIDFAAEELKKYMRMMMPETGDIIIAYAPEAKDGFRLGLLQDFDLPFTGTENDLDDEYYINMDVEGGYIAGSNPRSVLFGIYRYLKKLGVRFMFVSCSPALRVSTFPWQTSPPWSTTSWLTTDSAVTATRARKVSSACWKPSSFTPSKS